MGKGSDFFWSVVGPAVLVIVIVIYCALFHI